MPNWGYSLNVHNIGEIAKASGRELRISPKATVEICRSIKNMRVDEAKRFLQDVIEKKRPVIYRRYTKKVPHRSNIQGWYAGRYPVKASLAILQILDNAEANAQNKGLDVEKLKILHIASSRGRTLKRYTPRAFGRTSPRFDVLCHVEIALAEV